jgi:predicted nucleic acid-binding protein
VKGLTYDTGALIAAERGATGLWWLHRRAIAHGIVPLVPACVLAEAWRGGPQASLSRFLAGCTIEPFTERGARRVGALAAKTGRLRASIVDVAVVEAALRRCHVVVTSDPTDLRAIATSAGRSLSIEVV